MIGSQSASRCGTALKWLQLLNYAADPPSESPAPSLDLFAETRADAVREAAHDAAAVERSLRRLGKTQAEDEMNCGGCGYDTCREFAAALLDGRAECAMCVTYMRKLAMNKANALIRTMPAAVVIVDETLLIVECNRLRREARRPVPMIVDAKPGLEGAPMAVVAPESAGISPAAEDRLEALRRTWTWRPRPPPDRLHHRKGTLVGGIIQDITHPAVQKEQIIKRPRRSSARMSPPCRRSPTCSARTPPRRK